MLRGARVRIPAVATGGDVIRSLKPATALLLCWVSIAFCDEAGEIDRARALQQAGKLAEARKIFNGILSPGNLKPEVEGTARLGLSRVDLAEGRYPEAIVEGARAASLATSRQDRTLEGNALTATGLARMYSGDYTGASNDLKRALVTAQETHDTAAEVTRLNNIGTVFYFQGRYAEALDRYQKASAIVQSHTSESWNQSRRQLTAANIATVYQRLGQYSRALEAYASLRDSQSALTVSERAQLLANMGALYRRLGDPIKALETYRAAQSLYRQSALHSGELAVLNNIGIDQALDLQRLPEALRTFDEAIKLAERSGDKPVKVQSLLYRGETLYRLNRIADSQRDFESAASLAEELKAVEDRWKALYGLARIERSQGNHSAAQTLLRESIASIESIRTNIGSGNSRNGFLADKRQVYDLLIDLLIRGPSPDARDLFRLMEQSRARSLKDRKGTAAASDMESVRKNLGPGTVLIEYWIGDGSFAAVWLSAAGTRVISKTGVPKLRRDLNGLANALSTRSGSEWAGLAAALKDLLLPRDEAAWSGIRRLIIVPDRELARIPFEVLPWPLAEGKRVVDKVSVTYLASASFLRPATGSRAIVPFWHRFLMAFADPAQSKPGTESRLPGAVSEVKAISSILGGRNVEHIGADAKKEYLSESAPGYRVIHLATHAFVDLEDAGRSRILFAPTRGSQLYDYLYLKELENLNLSGVDLVTASACETAAGASVEGEGVENFSQAFLSAGARSVVSGLWRVDDRATAALMRNFYVELAAGADIAEALRKAKVSFLKSERGEEAPYYWAAFVLNGDGSLRLPYVVSWPTALAGTLALIGIVLLAVRARKPGKTASR